MAAPARVEVDARGTSQAKHEVVHGRVGARVATRLGEEADIVRVDVAVLGVQIVRVEAEQLSAHWDPPQLAGLRAGAFVVRPRHDGDLPLRGSDVLVA